MHKILELVLYYFTLNESIKCQSLSTEEHWRARTQHFCFVHTALSPNQNLVPNKHSRYRNKVLQSNSHPYSSYQEAPRLLLFQIVKERILVSLRIYEGYRNLIGGTDIALPYSFKTT